MKPHIQRHKRKERRDFYIQLLGGKCVRCGEKKNLEFDHIDDSTTSFRISQKLLCSSSRVERELEKCQLLCKACHIQKTVAARPQFRLEHGRASTYNNRKCRCKGCTQAWGTYIMERRKCASIISV